MKTLCIVIVLCVFSIIISLSDLRSQSLEEQVRALQIKKLMTTSEFKTCGLEKLSEEELRQLNTWLQSYTLRVSEIVGQANSPSTPDVIESHISGDFEGWDGETIFKLDNGQIWQQSSYAYTYHYSYHPEVTIYKTSGGYKMKVGGVEKMIYVRRLK